MAWSSARCSRGCPRSRRTWAPTTASWAWRCSAPLSAWCWPSRWPARLSGARACVFPAWPDGRATRSASWSRRWRRCPCWPLVLFAMALANGILDVAMNVQGVAVERGLGRTCAQLDARRVLVRGDDRRRAGRPGRRRLAGPRAPPGDRGRPVAGAGGGRRGPPCAAGAGRGPFVRAPRPAAGALGVAAFCVLLAEGSVTDWSAVLPERGPGAGEASPPPGSRRSRCSWRSAAGGRPGGRARRRPPAVIRARHPAGGRWPGPGPGGAAPAVGFAGRRAARYAAVGMLPATAVTASPRAARRRGGMDPPASGAGYLGLPARPATIALLDRRHRTAAEAPFAAAPARARDHPPARASRTDVRPSIEGRPPWPPRPRRHFPAYAACSRSSRVGLAVASAALRCKLTPVPSGPRRSVRLHPWKPQPHFAIRTCPFRTTAS